VPEKTQMKSNYLTSAAPEEPKPAEMTAAEIEEAKLAEYEASILSEEQEAFEKKQKVASAMHRARHAAISFVSLSCEAIYEIS